MRLIDADKMRQKVWNGSDDVYTVNDVLELIDKQPTIAAPRWVSVEEPPKEERRTYLVYTDTGYMCSCRWTNNVYGLGESDRWGWSIADVPQFQKVTHWMPIESPKDKED